MTTGAVKLITPDESRQFRRKRAGRFELGVENGNLDIESAPKLDNPKTSAIAIERIR